MSHVEYHIALLRESEILTMMACLWKITQSFSLNCLFQVKTIVVDNDSTTIAKVQDTVNPDISKKSDSNHRKKSFIRILVNLTTSHKVIKIWRLDHTYKDVLHILWSKPKDVVISYLVTYWKGKSSLTCKVSTK